MFIQNVLTISSEVAYVPKGNFLIHFSVKGFLEEEILVEISIEYHQGVLGPKELKLVKIVKDKYEEVSLTYISNNSQESPGLLLLRSDCRTQTDDKLMTDVIKSDLFSGPGCPAIFR